MSDIKNINLDGDRRCTDLGRGCIDQAQVDRIIKNLLDDPSNLNLSKKMIEEILSYPDTGKFLDKEIQEMIICGKNINMSNPNIGEFIDNKSFFKSMIKGKTLENQMKNFQLYSDNIDEINEDNPSTKEMIKKYYKYE